MMILLSILAVVALFGNAYALVTIGIGLRKLRTLGAVEPLSFGTAPMVSVIVPACNEAKTIEPALRSLLALEYDNVEILVVNDRSTDQTGMVLQKIQKEHPQLQVLTITALPAGWLGKSNALYQGASVAKGEYLLFTDADILFAKSTLSRAMSLMVNENLDHLSLIFKNIAQGAFLNAMMVDAGGGLFLLFKPWEVRNRRSKHFMGVGAFNLLRKSVYVEIGGHRSIKMHPLDDLLLGKIIKGNGFKQECMTAYDFLTVHWYNSTRQMIQGLMKNIFALYDFKVMYAIVAINMIFLVAILPQWGAIFGTGVFRSVCILTVGVRLLFVLYGIKIIGTTRKTVFCSLLTPYINIYIIMKGVLKTICAKGIEWRGTHYPLEKLKENMSIWTGYR